MAKSCDVCSRVPMEMRHGICDECAWRIASGVVRGEDGRSWAKAVAAAATLGSALAEFENAVGGLKAAKKGPTP